MIRTYSRPIAALSAAGAVILSGAMVAAAHFQPSLPDAATGGQDHAAAGAQNADPTNVWEKLQANHDRLLSNLNEVVDRLTANGADQAAIDAVTNVIDKLTNQDIGLNKAGDAVSGNHPNSTDHPSQP